MYLDCLNALANKKVLQICIKIQSVSYSYSRVIKFVKFIPKTETGKIKRSEMHVNKN